MPDDQQIQLDDLRFYFDSQAKDLQDISGPGRRNSQVIAIREKLMTLSDRDFSTAVQSIERLVSPSDSAKNSQSERDAEARRKNGRDLFEQRESLSGSGAVNEVSKV